MNLLKSHLLLMEMVTGIFPLPIFIHFVVNCQFGLVTNFILVQLQKEFLDPDVWDTEDSFILCPVTALEYYIKATKTCY